MQLSIVIVSFNTRELTLECLRSVLRETRRTAHEVIVVDNGSSDGSADSIAREFPEVQLIRAGRNLGFACANNLAAGYASGDFLLLLNSDTVVLHNAVDRLVAFAAEHPDRGIWGGRTEFGDGSLNPSSCWRFMSLWSLLTQVAALSRLWRDSAIFNAEAYGGWRRDTMREVDFVTGCFLLIDRKMWNATGGFDEGFFMYAEEADLCFRARKHGARPLFTPDATVIHHGGASEQILSAKIEKLLAGKARFLEKHWPRPKRLAGIGMLKLLALTRALGYSAMSRLTGSKRHKAVAAEWWTVWAARGVWGEGRYS